MPNEYLQPRFGSVALGKPHYESVYLTATSPDGSAIWIRYTVGKPAGSEPSGAVWFTRFGPDGVRAAKGTTAEVRSTADHVVDAGGLGSIDRRGARGALTVDGMAVSWELTFDPEAAPMSHLRRPWMYRSPIPKTKSTSPYPDMRVSGTVVIDGVSVPVDSWRGMLGHNWGSEHALRWVWLRGAGFAEDPAAWLDVVIGRIKVGPVTLPWFANGIAYLGNKRHRLGGAYRLPSVDETADGATIELRSPKYRVTVAVDAPLSRSVVWEYASPDGELHQVRNCSTAGLELTIAQRREPANILRTERGGIYELGTLEFDPELPMQPFHDRA